MDQREKEIQIIRTGDGSHTLYNSLVGDTYHSKHGAVQESRHVFIKNGLELMAGRRDVLQILELGFGTGLNAALSWSFALEHPDLDLHYVAYEKYPLAASQVAQLNYNQYLPVDFKHLHILEWCNGHQPAPNFQFGKVLADFWELQDVDTYDLLYFDVFAPDYQPEFWQEPFLKKIAESLKKSGLLVTYCAKGSFQRGLRKLDFRIEKVPGPPGKREMVRAWKN